MCKGGNSRPTHTLSTWRNEESAGIVSNRDITAGVSISASGEFQLPGQQALNGILLWRAYVNAEGGIRGGSISRPVRLIWYDDTSRANRTRENVLRLLRNDCVD